ncbi:plasmid pRiA4b ORF-3 family protein [Uruburuella testudinis]|uniref:Plasmid pRiA4b ORF-3 family protein n=1 Tax=Uruburuella testudinis TaxID=1282863 RepID=A0ABY4DVX0_9NEIS|nr:plasmid pRiA4b ORF-3 family protein [Uruburuella testudinis]UOO80841.1 plasmid pRiA4b ORF-3 family protein [Uruburuella testudinis]
MRIYKRPKAPQLVYQLHIRLMDSEPEIWRRILVSADIDLNNFHRVIQEAFEWEGYHLFRFSQYEPWSGNVVFPPTDEYGAIKMPNEMGIYDAPPLLRDVLEVGGRLFYVYDFGDDWQHEILCEALMIKPPKIRLPLCTDGANHAAFEDVGGVGGYMDIVHTIANQDKPEYQHAVAELIDAYGKRILKFDAAAFDPKKVKFSR